MIAKSDTRHATTPRPQPLFGAIRAGLRSMASSMASSMAHYLGASPACPRPTPAPSTSAGFTWSGAEKTRPAAHQTGASLPEILLVLGAAAATMAVVYGVYSTVHGANQAAQAVSDIRAITTKTAQAFSKQQDFSGLTDATAQSEQLYPSWMMSPGSGAQSAWGTVALGNTPVTSASGNSVNAMTIEYDNVPASACAKIVSAAGPGFYQVKARPSAAPGAQPPATPWTAFTNPQAGRAQDLSHLDPVSIAALCKSSDAGNGASLMFVWANGAQKINPIACVAPPPGTATQPAPCPAGEISTTSPYGPTSGTQTASVTYACNAQGTVVPTYGPWTTNGQSCWPACSPTSGNTAGTFTCPAGQAINTAGPSYGQTSAPTTTPWTQTCATPVGPLGAPVNGATTPNFTCAPVTCNPTSGSTAGTFTCPAGQYINSPVASPAYGSNTGPTTTPWTQTCSSPFGTLGAPVNGPTTPAYTCAPPTCTPVSGTTAGTFTCPAGQAINSPAGSPAYGSSSGATSTPWTQTCTTPFGPLGSPVNGATTPAYTCAATCTVPNPATVTQCGAGKTPWVSSSSCPAPTSSWTGEYDNYARQSSTATCPSVFGAVSWSPWADTGSTCTVNNCVPACSWGSPPATNPACPSPSWGTQPGTWVHSATCNVWTFNSSGSCPSCGPAPAPVTCTAPQTGGGAWTSAPGPTCWTPPPACVTPTPVYTNPLICFDGTCASAYYVSGVPATAFAPSPGFKVTFQITITYGSSTQTVSTSATVNTVTSASGLPQCSSVADYECSDSITGTPTVATVGGQHFTVSVSGGASQTYDLSAGINKWLGKTGAGTVTSP